MSQFIRIIRAKDDKEILFPLSSIWKIEVKYYIPATEPGQTAGYCSLKTALSSHMAMRLYTIFVGEAKYTLTANPGSKVMQKLEEIYNNALFDEGSVLEDQRPNDRSISAAILTVEPADRQKVETTTDFEKSSALLPLDAKFNSRRSKA